MKTIVVYYSRNGSNKYLANKIAKSLECDIEELKPRVNVFIFFLLNISFGIKSLKSNIEDYDRVILCGPIFVGRFIIPLKAFVEKYKNQINRLVFVTCCGSTYDKKEEKFGHGLVFNKLKEMLNGKCDHCEAFPIDLLLPDDQKGDDSAYMNTHLNDSNFKGEIKDRFDNFIKTIGN